jgi:uncharacterized membrane protein YbhN (UPF0104 family)
VKRGLGTALQIAVSIVLLALLARQVPLHEALDAARRVRPGTLAGALALSLVAYLGRSYRWAALLRHAGIPMGQAEAYRLTLVGTGYGLVTPGRVGEFARAAHVRGSRAGRAASVVWDRVADVLLLEVLALPAFLLVPAWRGPLLWIYLAMVAASVAFVVALDRPGIAHAVAARVPPLAGPLRRWAERATGTLATGAFARGIGAGLFFYAFSYGGAALLLRDLVPGAPPALLLSFPVIPLLGNLPIAFGGLGLREQVTRVMFEQLGAGAADGPVFSLIWFVVVTLVPGLLGLLTVATPWGRPHAPARGDDA